MVRDYLLLNDNNIVSKKNIAPQPYNSIEHFFEGQQGDSGIAGPRGLRGDRGLRGPAGPAGPIGPKGDGLNEKDMESRTLWCRDENNCATPNDIVARFRQDAYLRVGPNTNGGKALIVGGKDRSETGEPNIYTKNNHLFLDGGSTYMSSSDQPGHTYINNDNKGKTFINQNGTHTLLNDKDGFVGINMNGIDPQNNLHIRGDQPLTVENVGTLGSAGIILKASTNTNEGGQNWTVGANDLGIFSYDNNLEEYGFVTKNGSTGFGTQLPNPAFKLDVGGHGRYRQDLRLTGGPGASVQVNWNKTEGERSDWIKYFTKQDVGNLTTADLFVNNAFRDNISGNTYLITSNNGYSVGATILNTGNPISFTVNEIISNPDRYVKIKIGDIKQCDINRGLELIGGDNFRSKINFFGNEMDIQYGPLNKVLINFDRNGVNFVGPVKFQDTVTFNGPATKIGDTAEDPNKPKYSFKVLEDTQFNGNNYHLGNSYWGADLESGELKPNTFWTKIEGNKFITNNGVRLIDPKNTDSFTDLTYNSNQIINNARAVSYLDAAKGALVLQTNLKVDGSSTGSTNGIETPFLKSEVVDSNVIRTSGAIQYSDARLKDNIQKIDQNENIDNLLKMQGYNYKNKITKENDSGLIAQEVEKINSNLVDNNGEYKGIKYTNIIPMLVEAIKYQQKEIDSLKKNI